MSDDTEALPSEEIDLRLKLDPELGDLYAYLSGKQRKTREAIHLMRLGLMCVNGSLGAQPGQPIPAAPTAASKARPSRSGAAAPAPSSSARTFGRQPEATGLEGLGALSGFKADFFAAPPPQ